VTPELSIIVPLHDEEEVVGEAHRRLTAVLEKLDRSYEIIWVDDGSRDRTRRLVGEICERDPYSRLLALSRNFGHQFAITAGMDRSTGRAVVVIDADLQDPPEVIPELVRRWEAGDQVVYGVRDRREGEGWFKRATAAAFYRLMRRMASVDIPVDVGDFRLLDRQVVDELQGMRERSRYVRGMVSWLGFRQGEVHFVRDRRFAGRTKYPLGKMLHFAFDGLLSFSVVPLKLASGLGLLSAGVSFFFIAYGIVQKYFYPDTVIPGWSSLFSAILFIGGIQLICLGVLGEYVGRIYKESKQRPLYVIDEERNFNP